MSLLTNTKVVSRIYYDPSNAEHRKALKVFITTNKWTKHFIIEENVHNLPYKLMVQTLLWFMARD